MVDSGCPVGARCESCGVDAPGIGVVIATAAPGAFCVSACRACATQIEQSGHIPVTVATARRLATQHKRHGAAARYVRLVIR